MPFGDSALGNRTLSQKTGKISKNFFAVKYGKSDNLVAGEDGFDSFYQEFQNELDTIGKRPDFNFCVFCGTDLDNL